MKPTIANKKRFENVEQRKIQQDNNIKRWSNLNNRKKQSIMMKKAWLNPTIRNKYLDSMKTSSWVNVRCDKNQPHLIEKWNRLGFNFEINFKIVCGKNIYYLDGYDKDKNVVLEIDSKYHKKPSQIKKDLIMLKHKKKKIRISKTR